MREPQVSIAIPVYNGERYLGEALEAFLAQSFPHFEIVISDNASTDRTEAIARYVARDRRIRYSRNTHNHGLAWNYNYAFDLCRAPYFKWAAADDVCRPDYLSRCVEVLDRDPSIVLVYPATQFVDAEGNDLDIHDPGWDLPFNEALARLRYVIISGHWVNSIVGVIRRDALAKTRLMPTYPGGDYRVLGELSLLGKFHEIPERLFVRRIHPDASSQHADKGATPDEQWLVRYWRGRAAAAPAPLWSLKRDHFRTIVRSHLPTRCKISLLITLLRTMRWGRHKLMEELVSTAATFV